MAKDKKMTTLSVSVNQENKVSLKGTIDKTFKLANNRKRIYIYNKETGEKLFNINVKPMKSNKEAYTIDLEEAVEGCIYDVNNMNSKFGEIKIISLDKGFHNLRTSTIILEDETGTEE